MLLTLLGSDVFGRDARVREVTKNKEVVRLTSRDPLSRWAEVIGQADLFGSSAVVVTEGIIADGSASDKRSLAALLEQRSVVKDASVQVVFVESSEALPAKDALGDHLKMGTVELFPPFSQGQMVKWIADEALRLSLTIDRMVVVELARLFGSDRYGVVTELAKWCLKGGGAAGLEMLQSVVAPDGTVEIFGFVEAWAQRRLDKTLLELAQVLRADTSPQALIALLERQVRLMYMCTLAGVEGLPSSSLAGKLGVAPFISSKVEKASKKWSQSELEGAIGALYDLDWGIKTGKIEAKVGLELWVMESLMT